MMADPQKNGLWVVIPTYNRADDLIQCLDSLSKAGLAMDHIVVVDNASEDNTIELVEHHYPNVHKISLDNNLGATGASNKGFDFALERGADYVLRLDSDTVVAQDFLEPLVEIAESNPVIGAVSPKIYYYDNPEEIWYAGVDAQPLIFGAINGHRHELDSPENSQLRRVDYIWAAAMLIKRDVLQKTSGFDTDFFVYHEEIDFCERIRAAGFQLVFVPNSKVWHKVGSSANNAWTAYHWNRSKMLLYRKQAGNVLHKVFLIFYALIYVLVDALLNLLHLRKKSGNRGPLKDASRGLWDGMTEEV
jgi:hypothetical protein